MTLSLITGAAGMVGSHLLEALAARGEEAVATYDVETPAIREVEGVGVHARMNVCEPGVVLGVLDRYRPNVIYHLAAQSLPTVSWAKPLETMHTNAGGTVNVFEAVCRIRGSEPSYDPVIVVACSSAEYGASLVEANLPIREDAQLLPLHPYGVSKVAQDLLAFQYWKGRGVRCVRARIFNTTGPRKKGDVISDWAARVAIIMRRGEGELVTGNQDARRAILDVKDLVRALTLLADKGVPGEAYNISGSTAHRVGDLISIFSELAGIPIASRVDAALLRPIDEPIIIGDVSKLREATGWRQEVSMRDTLKAVLDYEIAHAAQRAPN